MAAQPFNPGKDKDSKRAAIVPFPEDRLPPQNIEAEQGVLGASCSTTTSCTTSSRSSRSRTSTATPTRSSIRAIRDLYDLGKADRRHHPGRGADAAAASSSGSAATRRSAQILNSVPHAANAKYYAEIVRQKSISRELIERANEILREGYSNNFTAEELLENAERRIFSIAEDQTTGETVELQDIVTEAMDRIAPRSEPTAPGHRRRHRLLRARRHHRRLPARAAHHPGRPAEHGQDGLRAEHLRARRRRAEDRAVLFVSLEMGQLELAERLLCARSRVDGHKLRTGQDLGTAR